MLSKRARSAELVGCALAQRSPLRTGASADSRQRHGCKAARHSADSARTVYVFVEHHGGAQSWGGSKELLAPDPNFGASVCQELALHGDTLVVGVPFGAHRLGVHRRGIRSPTLPRGRWQLESGHQAQRVRRRGRVGFGGAVAVWDDTILVAAPLDDDNELERGSAYVLQRDHGGANHWGQVKKLPSSSGSIVDGFRRSVTLCTELAAVG